MSTRRFMIITGLAAAAPALMAGLTPPKAKTATDCVADPEVCSEAQQRALLPHSNDPFWALLRACDVQHDTRNNTYRLEATPQVAALNGKTVQVKGFTVPLDGTDRTSHFLIAVNTPVCFYHPPGEPNEILEVSASSPITWDEKPKTVEGVFAISAAGDAGVYFKLTQAKLVAG